LAPQIGDATACSQYERNLIQYYVEKNPFCVFNYILDEIFNISKSPLYSCGYAPWIKMMIEKVIGKEFVKDVFITEIKSQAPTELTISPNVPSSSAARSTCFGATPPPPTSSLGGLLRVFKSMFRVCRDTRQRQDVLLSNQHCQNEKLDIDEFPLPEPPIDEDPFVSLTPVKLATMGSAPDEDDDYNENEDDDDK
jgi:hypothetical protein